MSTRSRAALLGAVAAAAALTLSACGNGGTSGGGGNTNFVTGNGGIATVAAGKRTAAPDLSGKTLDGKPLNVADFKGQVVVLNFWGSWCGPCRAEAGAFAKVAKAYDGKGVQFVGVNTRDANTTQAIAFEKERGVGYPSLYDPTGRLMLRFGKGTLNPQFVPSTLILDQHGRIAARALEQLDATTLTDMIKPVLAGK
ncbi:TlpA family protein disulfide reductase [Streptomyces sp. J2-1]|uniref:TlpA family protein disulfide reductase n=1 Tax=Streptomyces corallincola TaxID=2851888 RepID=UPI001C38FC47|nr:TlpA disulfide reductase family protein [Streptomyces corallincola]MBV2355001.1 TlpA family protein disulfide reductase [Streptomyces corallincola]